MATSTSPSWTSYSSDVLRWGGGAMTSSTRVRTVGPERIGPLTLSRRSSGPDPEAFIGACKKGDEVALRGLVQMRPGTMVINYQDRTGRTGLSYACSDGQMSLLQVLVELSNLDVNLADSEGNTPLMMAAQAGHAEAVSFLLERFRGVVSVDQRNQSGLTALMKAALQGRARCAKLLLSAGANPNLRDPGRRYSALEWAKFCGRLGAVETLEKHYKSAAKRFSFETKLLTSSPVRPPRRRTSESEAQRPPPSHPPVCKSDSDSSWLKQKLRRKSRADTGALGSATATAMMCASSAFMAPGGAVPHMLVQRPLTIPRLEVTNEDNKTQEAKVKKN